MWEQHWTVRIYFHSLSWCVCIYIVSLTTKVWFSMDGIIRSCFAQLCSQHYTIERCPSTKSCSLIYLWLAMSGYALCAGRGYCWNGSQSQGLSQYVTARSIALMHFSGWSDSPEFFFQGRMLAVCKPLLKTVTATRKLTWVYARPSQECVAHRHKDRKRNSLERWSGILSGLSTKSPVEKNKDEGGVCRLFRDSLDFFFESAATVARHGVFVWYLFLLHVDAWMARIWSTPFAQSSEIRSWWHL